MEPKYSSDEFLDKGIQVCQKCSGVMRFKGSGRYVCENCGYEYLTDFGKVKKFLAENGPSNAYVISEGTGVSRARIYQFIREGRVEVIEKEKKEQPFCVACGAALAFGRLCPNCAKKMRKRGEDVKGVYNGLIQNADNDMEMRFVGKGKGK